MEHVLGDYGKLLEDDDHQHGRGGSGGGGTKRFGGGGGMLCPDILHACTAACVCVCVLLTGTESWARVSPTALGKSTLTASMPDGTPTTTRCGHRVGLQCGLPVDR